MQGNNNKYVIGGIIAVLVVGFFVWQAGISKKLGLNSIIPGQKNGTTSAPSKDVAAQYENVFGIVEGVSGQSITVLSSVAKASGEISKETKSIKTNSATTFEKIVLKDPVELQKEFAAFSASNKSKDTNTPPPSPFNKKSISISDLKNGNNIMAVVDKSNMIAKSVVVQPAVPTAGK